MTAGCPQSGSGGWHSREYIEGDGPCAQCGEQPPDDHPLAVFIDHIRAAGMVDMARQIVQVYPTAATWIDRVDDAWQLHVAWHGPDGRAEAVLSWDPERMFEVAGTRYELPHEAVQAVIDLVRPCS